VAKPGDALALACRGIALWLHSAGQAPGFQRRIKLKSSARPREAGMVSLLSLSSYVKLCQAVSSYVKLSIQYDSICLFFVYPRTLGRLDPQPDLAERRHRPCASVQGPFMRRRTWAASYPKVVGWLFLLPQSAQALRKVQYFLPRLKFWYLLMRFEWEFISCGGNPHWAHFKYQNPKVITRHDRSWQAWFPPKLPRKVSNKKRAGVKALWKCWRKTELG
jgi:hypothetical protein